ncbi:hypothetical protein ACLB2K_054441 [Fragaria x ananassa]
MGRSPPSFVYESSITLWNFSVCSRMWTVEHHSIITDREHMAATVAVPRAIVFKVLTTNDYEDWSFREVESQAELESLKVMNHTDQAPPCVVFTKYHRELMKEVEKSMKESATSCTVVGALIVTMIFAAAFTIPGGNNEDAGAPMFLKAKEFMVFIISDAISLFSSTTSVMIFLRILTSRYKEDDFLNLYRPR